MRLCRSLFGNCLIGLSWTGLILGILPLINKDKHIVTTHQRKILIIGRRYQLAVQEFFQLLLSWLAKAPLHPSVPWRLLFHHLICLLEIKKMIGSRKLTMSFTTACNWLVKREPREARGAFINPFGCMLHQSPLFGAVLCNTEVYASDEDLCLRTLRLRKGEHFVGFNQFWNRKEEFQLYCRRCKDCISDIERLETRRNSPRKSTTCKGRNHPTVGRTLTSLFDKSTWHL